MPGEQTSNGVIPASRPSVISAPGAPLLSTRLGPHPQALGPRLSLALGGRLRASLGPQALLLLLMMGGAIGSQPISPPTRIISLIPAVTEMLFAIGAGGQVVGVSGFDRYPPEVNKLQRVGALLDPDLERILALRPDLVVVYGSQTDLKAQLERAKIPMFSYRHAALPDVMTTMREIGARVGRVKEAERAAGALESALDDVRRRVAGRARPRVLLVFGRESGALRGIYASGGIGFLSDMLDIAGGLNVLADVDRQSVPATTELVLARRPDVIVELRGTPATDEEARAMRADWNALASVPAVRSGRVYLIADERLVVPGPRVAEGTRLLASTLHPEAVR